MRILEAFGEPVSYGGQENFVINALDHMDRRGMEIDFLTPYYCDNESIAERVRGFGGQVYTLGCGFRPGQSRIGTIRPIKKFLRGRQYDIIHIHSGSSSMLAIYAAAARAAGIDRVIVHSHCTGKNDLRHAVSRLATVPILQKCASDFCACSEEAGRWRFSHAVCESRLNVIKNGIDPVAYAFDGNKRELIRSAYGVPDDAVLIGIFGRLSYQKNQLYMLRLLRRILDSREASDCGAHDFRIEDHTRYMLLFAGGGEDLAMLQTHARMMGLEDRVIFAGAKTNLRDYYSAADVLAVPSIYEGFGLVVLEAQAAGLEVIASDAVPRIADATGLVRFIPLDDREGWINALTSVHLRNNGTAADIKDRGYSIDKTAETVRFLYRQYR